VSVINPATNTVVATITVGSNPWGVAVNPAALEAGDVYVANEGSGTVSVINPATKRRHHHHHRRRHRDRGGGQRERHRRLRRQRGRRVGDSTPHQPVTATINLGSGVAPGGVAVSPPAPRPATSTPTTRRHRVGDQPHQRHRHRHHQYRRRTGIAPAYFGLAVSPTGAEAGDVYVTYLNSPITGVGTVSVIDPSTNTVGATITVDGAYGVAVSPPAPRPATSTSAAKASPRASARCR